MKSAVFFDIDNTIWDWEHVLPHSVHGALERLRQNGHLAFFNSGRSRGHVRDTKLLSLPLDGMVLSCGNYIEAGGNVLYEHCLGEKELSRIFEVAYAQHMPFILEGSKDLFMNPEEFGDDPYVQRLWKELGVHARRLDDLKKEDRINKFSAAITEETDFASVREALGDILDFLDHNGKVVEFIPRGSGKGKGIERACGLFDIDIRHTYAVGDSVNDLDMLTVAAHGICMGNGTKEAKEAAEYITASLHEDGVMQALLHYGLI
ncbi:MAG: HAD-IIB family hydrolase [Lachnospiraceae bacterium]|nr:HAD-IIB family hydrolase [Lachnospiraceae bacterium]